MQKFLKSLGPGLLFASTSIGVSHLVQSTRAGAEYGLALLWAVLLANILKYPFFEFASRYAFANKKSIIAGYKDLHVFWLVLYSLLTFGSMFIITAAVTAVTAGFFGNLYSLNDYTLEISIGLMAFSFLLVGFGQLRSLTTVIKVLAFVLITNTLISFGIGISRVGFPAELFRFSGEKQDWFFVIALMGWMPTALDLCTWNSLWTVQKIKDEPSLKWEEIRKEFSISYWATTFLSVVFLSLGTILIFSKNQTLSDSAPEFAAQIIGLYTETIGGWSYWLIASASFSIMIGTLFGVFDGYSRAIGEVINLSFNPTEKVQKRLQIIILIHLCIGSGLVLYFAKAISFKELIDLATYVSFLIAPVIAMLNFYLIMKLPKNIRPRFTLRLLAYLGIVYLVVFSCFYAYLQF